VQLIFLLFSHFLNTALKIEHPFSFYTLPFRFSMDAAKLFYHWNAQGRQDNSPEKAR
jgi:hypothetical protein